MWKLSPRRRRDLLDAAFLFLLALCLNVGGASVRAQRQLSDKLIRLHVVAHSDAPDDQSMKLRVRDRILEETSGLLSEAGSRAEAEAALRARLPQLADAASELSAYPVTLELRETAFPTRDYGAFALPAGRYLALRVQIGDGAGKNWWCVAFPPLCGATAGPSVDDGFTPDEIAFMTRQNAGYRLKFRAAEYWDALRRTFQPERSVEKSEELP